MKAQTVIDDYVKEYARAHGKAPKIVRKLGGWIRIGETVTCRVKDLIEYREEIRRRFPVREA